MRSCCVVVDPPVLDDRPAAPPPEAGLRLFVPLEHQDGSPRGCAVREAPRRDGDVLAHRARTWSRDLVPLNVLTWPLVVDPGGVGKHGMRCLLLSRTEGRVVR